MKRKMNTAGNGGVSRRTFLQSGIAAAAAGLTILPSHAAPRTRNSRFAERVPPNEKIQLACVGLGGMGRSIGRSMGGSDLTEVVALCDVDLTNQTEELRETYPDAPVYQDFRAMFAEHCDAIDAVTIGTPDHTHFPIAMQAMAMGKHVYLEKPLALTFRQVELLMEAQRRFGVVTQMGNQGHSGGRYMQFKTWSEAGVIRDVTRIDAWLTDTQRWDLLHDGTWDIEMSEPIPDGMDWDLWHADKRETRPYSWRLHPFAWRNWIGFGTGLFADWGSHLLADAHQFLELGLPIEIALEHPEEPTEHLFPRASRIRLEFAARNNKPPLTLTWYDDRGKEQGPATPPGFEGELHFAGRLLYGADDLVFYGREHHDELTIVPESRMKAMAADLPEYGTTSDHHENFLRACRGEEETRSSFDVAGPITQVLLLGALAQQIGGTLTFDPVSKCFPDNPEANALLDGPAPRDGWETFYAMV